MIGIREEDARVARAPRADRAHQQDRRAEATVAEVPSSSDGVLERRLVQQREVAVHAAEVQVHERVQQIARREDALFEHGEVVLHKVLQPLHKKQTNVIRRRI